MRYLSGRAKALETLDFLDSLYPDAECALHHRNPYELLVATILSAQCTDVRVNEVTPALFTRFSSPQQLASADQEELEELIKSTGFFRNKARNLVACAAEIVARHNGEVPQSLESLVRLPGVGRKTANVVLGNAFDIPGMVVDTHVKRIAYRLGWSRMQSDQWQEASETFRKVDRKSPLYPSAQELTAKSLQGKALPYKDPTTAGGLGALLPGLGHAYCERYRDGLMAFVVNGLFIWAAVEAFDEDQEVLGGMLAVLEAGWYTGNIYSAINTAHKHNRKLKTDYLRGLSDAWRMELSSSRKGEWGLALRVPF